LFTLYRGEKTAAMTRAYQREEARSLQVRRYQVPLARAAYELQNRLYTIRTTDYLPTQLHSKDEGTREYVRWNTLYLFAQYLAWAEILRREVQYLDLADEWATRNFIEQLDAVQNAFGEAGTDPGRPFRIEYGDQRAMGELAVDPHAGTPREAIGPAAFRAHSGKGTPLADWLDRLNSDLDRVGAAKGDVAWLVGPQAALGDLVSRADPKALVFDMRYLRGNS
jgi:hypothetical protein